MATEEFPNQSFNTVTLNGAANFTADGNTKPSRATSLFINQNDKMGGVRLPTRATNPLVLPATAQPHFRRKTVRTPRRHRQPTVIIWLESSRKELCAHEHAAA